MIAALFLCVCLFAVATATALVITQAISDVKLARRLRAVVPDLEQHVEGLELNARLARDAANFPNVVRMHRRLS